jgi:NADH-quinone oxidoreductase subunit L
MMIPLAVLTVGALFAVASFTALLTAFYMFRLLWLAFFGASRMDAETEHHVHESPPSMTVVLALLALGSAVGGFVAIPHYLEPMLPLPQIRAAFERFEPAVVAMSVVLAFAGLAAAAYAFGGDGRRADAVERRFTGLHRLLTGKYYIDELYDRLLGRPLNWISERVFLGLGDRVLLDGSLHGLAGLARRTAGALARVQTGNLQFYLFLALAGLVAALAWSALHV